ncbi:putative F-box protein [Raphanus sativus]|uniref:F-box protein At3g17620 n=1 Tax=Raphanus sativus TaxID=3726 RepID=A0A6J0P711_RAPSA|nr:putative F-box protein At3g17620 [Raphanus sativus]KAJ4893728.1 putative F-box protein [Raphanus sativus]
MTMMSKLSTELVEEILSRVPMTSMRSVRCTCRNWNTICKNITFTNKHLAQRTAAAASTSKGEILTVVMMNCSLHLMRVKLQRGLDPTVNTTGKLISVDDSYQVVVSRVCHCDGLLLCTTEAYSWLALWNPFTGQTHRICVEPVSVRHRKLWYSHALGYEEVGKSCHRVYKILRFAGLVHEIYALNSGSWRVLDVSPDWYIDYDNHGVSLKGNTYWYARAAGVGFLLCFDFTRERFGPRLPLPFESFSDDAVIMSSVGEGEDKLAVLFQHRETFEMEVWVTTKVEPNAVSWSMFSAVDMAPLSGFRFSTGGSFVIDEENAAVVVFDEDKNVEKPTRNTAYIVGFGESSYFGEVDLGKITTGKEGFPHACSYVPSSVQIKPNFMRTNGID